MVCHVQQLLTLFRDVLWLLCSNPTLCPSLPCHDVVWDAFGTVSGLACMNLQASGRYATCVEPNSAAVGPT